MAAGKASDFKVYNEYVNGRINELLAQMGDVFNGASNGALRLTTQSRKGDYDYTSLFSNVSGLAARRDTTSVGAQTDTAMTQDEHVKVKLNRKIIPVAQTRDAFRKIFGNFSRPSSRTSWPSRRPTPCRSKCATPHFSPVVPR
jgi:hypothetical protein